MLAGPDAPVAATAAEERLPRSLEIFAPLCSSWCWVSQAAAAAPVLRAEHIAFASPRSICVFGFCTRRGGVSSQAGCLLQGPELQEEILHLAALRLRS